MNKFIFTLMLGSVFSRGFVFRYHAGKVSVKSLSLFIRKHCVHNQRKLSGFINCELATAKRFES